MQFRELKIPAAGTWARDCELIFLTQGEGIEIGYYRNEDNTSWDLKCRGVVAYKLVGEELSLFNYLSKMPTSGAFYELLESPWIIEFSKCNPGLLENCKHCIFQFYDETIEIIASEFNFEQVERRPSLTVEEKKLDLVSDSNQTLKNEKRYFLHYLKQKIHKIYNYFSQLHVCRKKKFAKFCELKIPGKRGQAKGYELVHLYDYKGLKILYHGYVDNTYWSLLCEGVSAYKSTGKKVCLIGYLLDLPKDRAFYEIKNSPWIRELSRYRPDFFTNSKHYVLQFRNENIEVITDKLIFEQLKERPFLKIEEMKL